MGIQFDAYTSIESRYIATQYNVRYERKKAKTLFRLCGLFSAFFRKIISGDIESALYKVISVLDCLMTPGLFIFSRCDVRLPRPGNSQEGSQCTSPGRSRRQVWTPADQVRTKSVFSSFFALQRKCHIGEILFTGFTGSFHFGNFRCSQWLRFR